MGCSGLYEFRSLRWSLGKLYVCLQDTQDLYRIGRKVWSVSLRIKLCIFLESLRSNRVQLVDLMCY